MKLWINRLTEVLSGEDPQADDVVELKHRARWIKAASEEEIQWLLAVLRELPLDEPAVDHRLIEVFSAVQRRVHGDEKHGRATLNDAARQHAVAVYRRLGSRSQSRYLLLSTLTESGAEADLVQLAELLVEDPPADTRQAVAPLVPLFSKKQLPTAAIFPRLLDAIEHPSTAAAVIDLANFVAREKLTATHPAAERQAALLALFSGVVERLEGIEGQAAEDAETLRRIRDTVGESVALAVSLCDALALLGATEAVGKLRRAIELGHRRLKVEAASALARLGDEAGGSALVQMAADPATRLRALAYCRELGILQQVEQQYRSEDARAEAELVNWLAEPTHLGLPPQEIELVDTRTQYWPGFDEEITCRLFRYTYNLPRGRFTGVGIVGPLTHSFLVDMTELSIDEQYSAFAGWQAEHRDIYEIPAENFADRHRRIAATRTAQMHSEGCAEVQPLLLGHFFEKRVLVARAARDGEPGTAVADEDRVYWFSAAAPGGLDPETAYCVYKGRQLMQAFNRG